MSINVTVTAGLTAGLTTGPAAMGRVTNILRARRITAIRSDRGEGKIPMVPSRLLLLHVWSLVAATVPHHNTSNDDEYQRKQPPSTHTESNHQRLICSACTTIARRPGAVPARLYRPIDEAPIRSAEAGQPIVGSAVPDTTAQCPHTGDRVPAFRCHIPKPAAFFAGGSARVVAPQYVEEQVTVVVDVRVDPPEPPALEGMGADSGEQGR